MKKIKLWFGILCIFLALGLAAGCSKKDTVDEMPEEPPEETREESRKEPTEIVLADFEKWAPDFQTLRLRNEFGSIDVNTDTDYVKSGKQSAALTVVGSSGSENPWFFVNTVSTRFAYDYSDFSCIDSISAWFYNASDTDEQLHAGLITNIVCIEQNELQKYDTFTLKPGWNEVVYTPDMNYVISAVGQESYQGIQGVYFMFENPHAASKAEGKRFYVDDVTLHYGEEKPFTEVRAGSYYTSGTKIGEPGWIILKNPVKMEDLEDKALHFEFKFDTDTGRFGFAICCNDYQWSNITGTLIIEKTTDGVVSNIGRIVEQEDGWYAWELNSDMFEGDGAEVAEDVSLIYHQNEVVQGNVIIDWNSMRAADAYPMTREESSQEYTDGDLIYYHIKNGVPMNELAEKALQFEFKFASKTGKFGFAFMDGDPDGWKNITGTLVIEKKNGVVTSNIGKIVETEDGWYAWRLDSDLFAGDGVSKAKIVDLACDNNGIDGIDTTVQGTVYIDWKSLKAVELKGTREELSDKYTDGGLIEHHFRNKGIPMADLEGKALQFEFKFASETGKFGFAFLDSNPDGWKNITGTIVIEKKDGKIVSNIGKIEETGNGWYVWRLNHDLFAGSDVSSAGIVDFAYHDNGTHGIDTTVQGTVYIDWKSVRAVEAYPVTREDRSQALTDGDLIWHHSSKGVSMAELAGKALQFEFKFTSEAGKFGFAFMDNDRDWANITGTIVIEKKDGRITSNMGRIEETGDGWYAWKLNRDLFAGSDVAKAQTVDLAYHNNGTDGIDTTVQGTVYIDWDSMHAVEAYPVTREDRSQALTDGDLIWHHSSKGVSMAGLSGKALQFEFKFTSETGKFGFALMDNDWTNVTGTLVIEKKDGKIMSNMGKIEETGDGWYAWKLNRDQFAGEGASKAKTVGLAYHDNGTHGIDTTVQGTVYIDWESMRAVEAYPVTREERCEQYADGGLINKDFNKDVSMAELSGKALQFEFKFTSTEGKFGFALMDNDWTNVTGTLVIEKKDGKIMSNMGKIEETGDGWYAWKLNRDQFAEAGAATAQTVGLAYHNNGVGGIDTTVQGTVYIDWESMCAVEAYSVTREECCEQYADGGLVEKDFSKDVPMAELSGKALQFEFKFTSETGKFGFALMDNDWKNITGTLVIEKKDGVIVSNIGKIEETKDGWYAWKLNRDQFAGGDAAAAQTVGLAYHDNGTHGIDTTVQGTVYIDWDSMCAVDAYSVNREERCEQYADGGLINKDFNKDVSMAELSGKALQFEFKFTSTEGKFGFALMDNDWTNVTGTLVIEKKNGKITSNIGKIEETGDGWYAWKLNRDQFAEAGAATAQTVGLAYHNNGVGGMDTTVQGTVYIDWDSMCAVEAYPREDVSEQYTDGAEIYKDFTKDVPMIDLSGKALQFEFKFTTETGKFGFALMDNDWTNITGTLVIEKKDGKITSNIGKIEETKDGWYAWKLNRDRFAEAGAATAQTVGLVYHNNGIGGIDTTVQGTVYIDWDSMCAVDAYVIREEHCEQYTNSTEIYKDFSKDVPMADLSGKALQFEFKFSTETGKFGFALMNNEWRNVTGTLVIEKKDGVIVSNIGKIEEAGDGWYAWKLNSDQFAGDGVAGAQNVGLAYHNNGVGGIDTKVQGTVYIDWDSMCAVDAYAIREARSQKLTDGNEIWHHFSKAFLWTPIYLCKRFLSGK